MSLISLIFLGIAIYYYFDKRKYDNSEYKRESGNSYFKMKFDTGIYGEYLTYNNLESIKGKFKLLVNVYVPKDNGETTEIDLICIHETGIYVMDRLHLIGQKN